MKHLLSLVLLALVAAPAAFGQGKGFSLGAGLQRTSSTIDLEEFGGEEDSEAGFGLGITADYGFSDLISIFLNVDGSDIDGATVGHLDLGARFHFRAQEQLFPYAQVALTGVSVSDEEDDTEMTMSGGALTLGGGVHYFFNPKLALDVNLAYSAGQFTTIEVDDEEFDDFEIDMSSFRIKAGIMYFFNRQ